MSSIDMTQFEGHTAGPWRWEFNAKNRHVGLCGGVPAYDLTVMDFARWGMGGAQPVFLEPGTMPTLHRLSDRADWLAPIAGREHHAHWCSTVTHPDARLIAAAPALLAEVKRQAAEIKRLHAALADAERKGAEQMREAAAGLCRQKADSEGAKAMEVEDDEPDMVDSLKATAWDFMVMESKIRALPLPTEVNP